MAEPDDRDAGGRAAAVGFLVVFLVALAVRLSWVEAVQSPVETVSSDMRGYIERARWTLAGEPVDACFPPGAHWVFAAILLVVGPDDLQSLGWVQCVLGALTAAISGLLARELTRSTAASWVVGLVVACWYPLVTEVGFFASEVPYGLFLVGSTWLVLRASRGAAGGAWAGVLGALAYLVRPTMLAGVGLQVGVLLAARSMSKRLLASLVLPLVLAVGLGSLRYWTLTGHAGLISSNSGVQSLFAWSDYAGVEAVPPKGVPRPRQTSFHPPTRSTRSGYEPDYVFTGERCDPEPVLAERDRVLARSPLGTLAGRLWRNVQDLFGAHRLWPERREAKGGLRLKLLEDWGELQRWLFGPMVVLVMGFDAYAALRGRLPRRNVLLWAAIAGMVIAAALYTGERRYRVPYDPILLALVCSAFMRLVGSTRGVARAPGSTDSVV